MDFWSVMGECKHIEVKISETVVATSDKKGVEEHLIYLKDILANSDDEVSKEYTNNRIVKINGSIANLFVNKTSVTEMSFNYDRYDDSIKATRNSIKNGVVSGGGRIYIHIAKELLKILPDINQNEDFLAGYTSMINSLRSILMVNLKNSNHNDEEIKDITQKLFESDDIDFMYDTVRQDYCNSRESGVLESYLSSIVCIRNAFSVSKIIINTGCTLVEVPKLNL